LRAFIKDENDELQRIASCVIILDKNEYSSNLINTWEGKAVLNTKDNAVLS
jgi:hypothetical protein